MTLLEFFEQIYWPNKLIRVSTAQDYSVLFRKNVRQKFGDRKMLSITVDEWTIYFSQLVAKGMSKSRVNRLHAVLSAIYKMAVKFNYAAVNPLQRVDWFEDELHDFDYWSLCEVQRFLNWAGQTQNPRFALYQTAYETGMRLSELLGFKRDCAPDLLQSSKRDSSDHKEWKEPDFGNQPWPKEYSSKVSAGQRF